MNLQQKVILIVGCDAQTALCAAWFSSKGNQVRVCVLNEAKKAAFKKQLFNHLLNINISVGLANVKKNIRFIDSKSINEQKVDLLFFSTSVFENSTKAFEIISLLNHKKPILSAYLNVNNFYTNFPSYKNQIVFVKTNQVSNNTLNMELYTGKSYSKKKLFFIETILNYLKIQFKQKKLLK